MNKKTITIGAILAGSLLIGGTAVLQPDEVPVVVVDLPNGTAEDFQKLIESAKGKKVNFILSNQTSEEVVQAAWKWSWSTKKGVALRLQPGEGLSTSTIDSKIEKIRADRGEKVSEIIEVKTGNEKIYR